MSAPPDPHTSHRNTHVLQLGGIRFYGDAEALRRTTRVLDQAAQALHAQRPARFPSGVGRARQVITRRLRAHFAGGITEGEAARWLAAQNWSTF